MAYAPIQDSEASSAPIHQSIELTDFEKQSARYFAWLVIVFTSINYGFTSAAQAAKYETLAARWGWGAYFVTCSVVANAYFDFEAVEEDIALPLKKYLHHLSDVSTPSAKAWEAAGVLLSLLVVFGAFNTSFTTKIPGQEGIETFSGDWPNWANLTLQVANDIYALVFVTALFSSGTFQLPSMVQKTFQPKSFFELASLGPSLAVGSVLGLGAYLVFANTLIGFPEHQGEFHDPFNRYLADLITAAPWTAYLSALTRGSFCILFAQRGFVELTKQVAALFKSSLNELPVRLGLLAVTGLIAFGSIAPSAFQAGAHEDLSHIISACAFLVNGYGLAVRLRKSLEHEDPANAPKALGCIGPMTPIHQIFPDDPSGVQAVFARFCSSRPVLPLADQDVSV